MIRVELPSHLRQLARVDSEVMVEVTGEATQRTLLDAVEAKYPMLKGAIRDHVTRKRRPYVRFYAGQDDLSHVEPNAALPRDVVAGREVFIILGAIAGGSLVAERS